LFAPERFASHADAKAQLFDDLEVFYNQRRRHSAQVGWCEAWCVD
jgi:hypothetical protein